MTQDEFRYLSIHNVIRMFPSCITDIKCAAFLLIVIQEDRLLTILVLEVTAIHAGEGLLVNLRWYAASFSMMIGDLKQWLVTHLSSRGSHKLAFASTSFNARRLRFCSPRLPHSLSRSHHRRASRTRHA